MNLKRPAVIISVIAILLCAAAALCLLLRPQGGNTETVPAAAEAMDAVAAEDAPGVYLRVNFDGAYQLKIRPCVSQDFVFSGGCVNADGSPFKKGELVYVEQLESRFGSVDFIATALDENGETLYIDGDAVERQFKVSGDINARLELDFDVPDNSAYLIKSVDEALSRATGELKILHEMGILSAELTAGRDDLRVWLISAEDAASASFPGRSGRACYYIAGSDGSYYANMRLDIESGKLTDLTVQAKPAEGAEPEGILWSEGGKDYYYYGNFGDIFPEDMSLDRLCTLLSEYWGFDGYTLSGTKDESYGYDTAAPDGNTLLRDFSRQPYLTVYFDGDEEGVPMYIEVMDFPTGASLMLGAHGHGVG